MVSLIVKPPMQRRKGKANSMMNSPELSNLEAETFTVATWNILLDNTRTENGIIKPQFDRVASQIETLMGLREELGSELDAVAIQEAQKENGQHNGEYLSTALGYGTGQWVEHNKKPYPESPTGRIGEHVGFFGARIEHAEAIELGDNRRAIITKVGEVAIANIHPRAGKNTALKEEQVRVVLDYLKDYPSAVYLGDFNCRPGGIVRQTIETDEFEDVFSVLGKLHPTTWPTPDYLRIMRSPKDKIDPELIVLAPAVILDDIYVRNVNVHDAGIFVGDSDHAGIWAKLSHNSVKTR